MLSMGSVRNKVTMAPKLAPNSPKVQTKIGTYLQTPTAQLDSPPATPTFCGVHPLNHPTERLHHQPPSTAPVLLIKHRPTVLLSKHRPTMLLIKHRPAVLLINNQ